jgi:hypothetical protein
MVLAFLLHIVSLIVVDSDDEKRAYNNAVLALRKLGRSQSRLISAIDSGAARQEQAKIKSQQAAAEFDNAVRRARAKLRGEPEPDSKPAFGIRTADSTSRDDSEEWGVACERLRQEIREKGLGSKRLQSLGRSRVCRARLPPYLRRIDALDPLRELDSRTLSSSRFFRRCNERNNRRLSMLPPRRTRRCSSRWSVLGVPDISRLRCLL